MAEKTRFDKIFVKIKNNPVLAVIIALGVIVMALSSFTNAARNLLGLLSKETERANVTGTWQTQALTNQFNTKQKWTLTFEFDAKDTTLLGTVTLTPLGDNRSYKNGIQEGKIEGHNISFFTRQTAWWGTEKMVYKDVFYGTVSNDEIEFIQNSDRQGGFIPQKFVAEKVE